MQNILVFVRKMPYNNLINLGKKMNPEKNLENESISKKKLEEELLKARKEIDELKKGLCELEKKEIVVDILPVLFHKLKNKLTPILGYCQILYKKTEDNFFKEKLKKIERSTNNLTHLINILREYFNNDTIIKQKGNLNNIIYGLEDYFANIEKTNNIKIDIDTDKKIPDDFLSVGQIETLIINIINNSINAIRAKHIQHGVITIKTELKENMYKLIVRDNGIGISKEKIFDIWSPFYSDFPGNHGIGLSICEKILENHGAVCNVNSVQGEHTVFEITFKDREKKSENILKEE